jgi:hypothetical protein
VRVRAVAIGLACSGGLALSAFACGTFLAADPLPDVTDGATDSAPNDRIDPGDDGPAGGRSFCAGVFAYFPFDGTTIAAKPPGIERTNTGGNIAFGAGRFAGGVHAIDGIPYRDERVPDVYDPSTGSVSFWVKPDYALPYADDDRIMFRGENGTDSVAGVIKWDKDGTFTFRFIDADAGNHDLDAPFASGSIPWNQQGWNHIAAAWNQQAGRLVLSVNGVLAHHQEALPPPSTVTGFRLGENANLTNAAWYDDVAIWKRPLTDDELTQIAKLDRSIGEACNIK